MAILLLFSNLELSSVYNSEMHCFGWDEPNLKSDDSYSNCYFDKDSVHTSSLWILSLCKKKSYFSPIFHLELGENCGLLQSWARIDASKF